MDDSMNHEDMLLRTVQAVEACNLAEILPLDVFAWFEQRRAAEIDAEEKGKSEALKFLEGRVQTWKQRESAGICSVPPRSRSV